MRHIIALGGGGFSMEPENPLLDQYILRQSNKEKPEICFIPTASGDSDSYISRFYHSFNAHHCVPSHLSLFKPPTRDLESYVLSREVIVRTMMVKNCGDPLIKATFRPKRFKVELLLMMV